MILRPPRSTRTGPLCPPSTLFRSPCVLGFLKRTRFDYAKEVGSGSDASVVMAPIQWVQRAFPELRLRVQRGRGDDWKEVDNHPLVELIGRPNAFYSDEALWMGTLFSWYTAGNAYWLKIRDRTSGGWGKSVSRRVNLGGGGTNK